MIKTGAWHAPVITDKEKCGIGTAGICRRLARPITDEVGNARYVKCRATPRRAQQQLLMDGTAVESAFALLLTKVTKLAVSGTFI